MSEPTAQFSIQKRVPFAVLAGLLLASAFPKIGIAGFAYIAPGAFLAVALGVDGKGAFRLGYIAGLTHYLASLYWLLNIPVFKLAPIAAWLALSAFLALYSGCWVWLCWKVFPKCDSPAPAPAPPPTPQTQNQGWPGVLAALDRMIEPGWIRRLLWTLFCAALWVTWEMTQARLFSGFPWNFLGASQYRMLPVIQIASFTGVYGVSFLAAWFSVSLLCAGAVVLKQSQRPRLWMLDLAVPLLVLITVLAFGSTSFVQPQVAAKHLNVALIQPSIPQQWIWSEQESSNRFQQLLQLSEKALESKPDLLVWPEAAVPGLIRWETNVYHAVTNLVSRHNVWLVMGADDIEPPRKLGDPFDSFNSSFLIGPDGGFHASYRKRRLVIFGEYIPLHRVLPFIGKWTGMGSFTPGREVVAFRVPELDLKTAVLICFEDVFPHLVGEYVDPDTDFLLNLTNNGWFGESAAQWQHAANGVFRAVENGIPLVRCANNGLTCWVTPQGAIRDEFFPGTTDAYGPGFKLIKVPLLNEPRSKPTFHRRHGDVFGWVCVAWSALGIARLLLMRRKPVPA